MSAPTDTVSDLVTTSPPCGTTAVNRASPSWPRSTSSTDAPDGRRACQSTVNVWPAYTKDGGVKSSPMSHLCAVSHRHNNNNNVNT